MNVRSDVLRIYKTLHTWVGITSGLVLFIGFFAGSLTMFASQLEHWSTPPSQQLEQPYSMDADALFSQVIKDYPDARKELAVRFYNNETQSLSLHWKEHEDKEAGHGPDLDARYWHATQTEDGQLVAKPVNPSLLGDLIDLLHQTAGIPGMVGHEYFGVQVLGVAAALYFIALVSGLIILLPTLVKDFFALRTGKNRKRFWLDTHNIIGITSLPFHLIIAFTVVVFAFHDIFYGSLKQVVYQDVPLFGASTAGAEKPLTKNIEELLPLSTIIANIEQAAPDYQVTELLYMRTDTPRPMVRASIYHPNHLVRGPVTSYVGINPFSGELMMTSMLPGQSNAWSDTVVTFFALHFGSFGGEWMRWVYFLLGLSGAFLFYSGNLLWIETRRKHQKRGQATPTQQRNTLLMAAATVGVCLGSMAAVALTMSASKWGRVFNVADINTLCLQSYYVVFLSAVVFAFWRGAARAAVPLLLSCALACLLIPITSWLSLLLPDSGLWMHIDMASFAVDGTAFVMALVFVYIAYRTHLRLRVSTSDSVWI